MAQVADEYDHVFKDNATVRGGPIVSWKGNYSGATLYQTGDTVQDMGSPNNVYLSIANNNQGNALTDMLFWKQIGGT